MPKLFLVRHGESEWNQRGVWTGWSDETGLTEKGMEEARKAGEILKKEKIDKIYVSDMKRAKETMEEIKKVCGSEFECLQSPALKERSYGIYTGKNKWQIKEEIGEEAFQKLRRGWDEPIPEGETLKDVYNRVVPYYEENIKKDLEGGKSVLVVAHGNSLRALVKRLENLDEKQVCELELGTGEVHCYDFDKSGEITGKEIKK